MSDAPSHALVPYVRGSAAAPEPLAPREQAIVDELAREGDARIAFQGLRRRLGLHPQALIRSLRSLQSQGYVAREPDGYRLARADGTSASGAVGDASFQPIFAAVVPSQLDASCLADQLSHRWFQGLRWYGRSRRAGEQLLVWNLEGSGQSVRLRVTNGLLGLEVEPAPNGGPLPYDRVAPLLEAVAAFYSGGPRALLAQTTVLPRPAA